MKKLLNSLALLLLVLSFLNCEASSKVHSYLPKWILSKIEGTKTTNIHTNFYRILSDKRINYIGFIGSNYQRLKIEFHRVQMKNAGQYDVVGISIVKKNRCHFHGTINIIDNREFISPTFGVDESMKGKFKRRGCSIAKYRFEEDPNEAESGFFSGYLLFFWYETNNNRIIYDDIDDYSDPYCNNQYAGIWQSYKTKKSKPCAWGQYRIPISGDLDIGAAEFSVNPKYLHNGWEDSEDKHEELSDWIGSYETSITCELKGKDYIPGTGAVSINYDITIGKDSCIVTCAGFQSYYSVACTIYEIKSNSISLKFKKLLDGDTFVEHYEMPFLTIYRDKQNIYVKSLYITDKEGRNNKLILLKRYEL